MTSFDQVLQHYAADIEDIQVFKEFCHSWGYQANLIVEKRHYNFITEAFGTRIWDISDPQTGEKYGIYAADYVEKNTGFEIVTRHSFPYPVIEIQEMEIVKKYERYDKNEF